MTKKKIELIVISTLIIYSFYCSITIGPTYDEFAHYKNGENLFNYLFSFGRREYVDPIYFYHFGLYDFLGSFFSKNFTSNYIVESHHILNLIFSTFSIIGIYQVAKKLFNKKIAKIAFLISFVNPIIFGHFSINPKDAIIAFSYIWILYLAIKYVEKQESFDDRINYLIYLTLLISLGLSIRLTFVFILFPIFIVLLCEIIFLKKKITFSFIKFFFDLFIIIIFSFVITIFFWPDAHPDLFRLPFELINKYFVSFFSSNFGLPYGLINGEFYLTQNTPKNYIFIFLLYKMPIYIILSLFLLPFFILYKKFLNKEFSSHKNLIYVFIQIFFPISLIVISGTSLNDGLRYILYIIPFICLASSISIFYVFNSKYFFYKFLRFIFILLFAYNFVIFIQLTPYQYTFINSLNGKFSNNLNKFENDYWGASIKELLVRANDKNIFDKKKYYKIATCGLHSSIVKFYLNKDFDIEYNFVNTDEEYDYIFFINRTYAPANDLLYNNLETCFNKFHNNIIVSVARNGLPIAFVSN